MQDDYGTEWLIGHYTQRLVPADSMVKFGPVMPYPSAMEPHWDVPEAKTLRTQSFNDFNQAYKNCNTCIHLLREKQVPCSAGFMTGTCKRNGGRIKFHPHDAMYLDCHVDRSAK